MQTGTGTAWKSVAVNGTTYSLALPAGTHAFGVAYACAQPANGSAQQIIIQATTADTTSLSAPCPTSTPTPSVAYISGSIDVSALPAAQGFNVFVGIGAINGLQSDIASTYQGVANSGIFDVVALAYTGYDVVGGEIVRGQTITNGAVINVPPFTSADAATIETISLPALQPSYIPTATVSYVTAGGTHATLSDPSNMLSYGSIPSSQSQANDYYDAVYTANRVFAAGEEAVRAEQTFAAPQAIGFSVPTAVSFPGITPSTTPALPIENAALPPATHIYDTLSVAWNGSPYQTVSMYITSAWLAGATSYTMPNLSALSSMFVVPSSGTTITWSDSAIATSESFSSAVASSSVPIGTSSQSIILTGFYGLP